MTGTRKPGGISNESEERGTMSIKLLRDKSGCPKNRIENSRQKLNTLVLDFLKAVAIETETKLGPELMRPQESYWLVQNGPGWSAKGKSFKRKTVDREKVFNTYLKMKRNDFPERELLNQALSEHGVLMKDRERNFIHPLVVNWLRLSDPFSFEESAILELIRDFGDAVLDEMFTTISRIAIEYLEVSDLPIVLEKGIIIRDITKAELYELGDIDARRINAMPSTMYGFDYPKDTWKILELQQKYGKNTEDLLGPAYAIYNAVLLALRLESTGHLGFIDLGSRTNFGEHSLGTSSKNRFPREIGMREGKYSINSKNNRHFRDCWANVRKIMELDSHYLRLPAQRLFDGGLRENQEDAIIDYAIGLERLLTAGINNELSYRFSLRGATILGWNDGNKELFFNKLNALYKLRSSIVHGSIKNKLKSSLKETCSNGEDYLRKIWWWYFENGFRDAKSGLMDGTEVIDSSILKTSYQKFFADGAQ